MREEYEDILKGEVQRAISADEDAIKRLATNYIENVRAYTQHERVRNRYTGRDEEPDERLMRSIEEKIDIPDSRKDDFRQEIMNYIGALALDGKKFEYNTNARLLQGAGAEAVRGPARHDQAEEPGLQRRRRRDAAEDRRRQAAADQVLRLQRNQRDGRAELRREHLRPGGQQVEVAARRCHTGPVRHRGWGRIVLTGGRLPVSLGPV